MKKFDIINTPFPGTNLIEASAGTGKTYTIAGLFLRLILEERFSVDQILVVTFTKAATEELKDRIRKKLLEAKVAFYKGSSDDILIDSLVKKYDNTALGIQLIEDALIDFDLAAIFTIHGFCQRILHENTFETGSLFDTELLTNQANLMQEVADDYWRKHFYNSPQEFVSYAIKKIKGPEYFFNLLEKIKTTDIKIIPYIEKPELKSLDKYKNTFKTLKTAWPISRGEVEVLLKGPALKGNIYGSLKPDAKQPYFTKRDLKILSMIEAMDRFVDTKSTGFPLFKDFEKFTRMKLVNSVKNKHIPPSHEVFDLCDKLYAQGVVLESEMEAYLLFLKTRFFEFAESELPERKKNKNIQLFDDLLTTVKQALEENDKRSVNVLATSIRTKYKAALVDEFQDTDSIQYEIFSRLFASKDSILFMIGDPKQAIYGFRGADIFSYMKAAANAEKKYTLLENWRSSPGLITAVNTIFSNVKAPFVFNEIPFENGTAGKKFESIHKKSDSPLKLWFVGAEGDKPLPKSDAVQRISEAVANEIARLVSPALYIESDRVEAGDIAVLVRTNRQAQMIKRSLSEKNVPSVLYSAGNIFDSHEAMEMERILLSISEPGNERLLKSALVTDMMGVLGEDFDSEGDEPLWWETRLTRFREYFRLWNRYGFIRMFSLFMAEEKVRGRLLSFPDGERRLTNVLHLAEILHQESIDKKPGIAGLLKWLSEQRDPSTPRLEEHQLRLESDDHAVTIVTIHKSKGLEYPVVFSPFSWEGSLIRDDEVAFHDDGDRRLTLDLGSREKSIHIASAQNELLAENLRLLYVALTRAKTRCYLVWGRINTAETSAMSYLFHCKQAWTKDDIVGSLKKTFSAKNDDDLLTDLNQLAKKSQGTIELVSLPLENDGKYASKRAEKEKLGCRKFSGKIDTSWKISSYSSLVSRRVSSIEIPDRDAYNDSYRPATSNKSDSSSLSDEADITDIFSFPRGARAGTFFHDIFEHLDFATKNLDNQKKLVAEKLKEYGFDQTWKETVCSMIQKVVSVPLLEDRKDLILSSVPYEDRINEMEFYFPLKPVTPQKLKQIFTDYGGIDIPPAFPDRLEKLVFSPSSGFMKGYIDMIFQYQGCYYLVDWKSNFLGAKIEDYAKDALDKAMTDELYILQYHIYTLALHQYLRMRIPGYQYETDFGGVFYIFIRGVDPVYGPEFGIFNDFPNRDLINALGRALIPFSYKH